MNCKIERGRIKLYFVKNVETTRKNISYAIKFDW